MKSPHGTATGRLGTPGKQIHTAQPNDGRDVPAENGGMEPQHTAIGTHMRPYCITAHYGVHLHRKSI